MVPRSIVLVSEESRYEFTQRFVPLLAKIFHASVLVKDHVRAAGYPLNTRSKAKKSAPTNSEQKVTKRTKFLSDEPYNLRFLRFLLFMISAPSVML